MKQMTEPTVQLGKWLGGAAAGALLMYMLDPERGRARRASSGEKLRGLGRQTGGAVGSALRDLGSAVGSTVEHLGSKVGSTAVQLGTAVGSTSETIGHRLAGATEEMAHSVSQAAGGARPVLEHPDTMTHLVQQGARGQWTLGTRSAAILGGGALGVYGLLRRGSPVGLTLGLAGLALLMRGTTNQPWQQMLTAGPLGHAIELEKSIRIDASPEHVYDIWTHYENFPKFMSHVLEVRDLGAGRSHWRVEGPAGTEFEWNAVLTEQSRPHRLAWRSEPGAQVSQSGSIEFEPVRGGTRVTVRMSYTPPAGMVGRAIATLLGANPKRQLEDDLAHMKELIERGGMPYSAARPASSSGKFLH